MKIVQFTDIHIGGKNEKTRKVDVRRNLKFILKAINAENADLVVLSGDLCFDAPQESIYKWITKQLVKRNINALVIPGNHDDSVMLANQFDMPLKGSEVYYDYVSGHVHILFLDTAKAKMSEKQWSWLSDKIASDKRLMVFMHHPPVQANMPFMDDNHAFEQQERFQELFKGRKECTEVFCGHYHIDKSISQGNLHVHITPSCFFQIRDDIKEFGVDHYRIGYRVIDVDGHGISHSVKYL